MLALTIRRNGDLTGNVLMFLFDMVIGTAFCYGGYLESDVETELRNSPNNVTAGFLGSKMSRK